MHNIERADHLLVQVTLTRTPPNTLAAEALPNATFWNQNAFGGLGPPGCTGGA